MHDPMTLFTYSFTTPPAFGLELRLQEHDIPGHTRTLAYAPSYFYLQDTVLILTLYLSPLVHGYFVYVSFDLSEGAKMINVYY